MINVTNGDEETSVKMTCAMKYCKIFLLNKQSKLYWSTIARRMDSTEIWLKFDFFICDVEAGCEGGVCALSMH